LVRPEPGRLLSDLSVSPDNRAALPWLRFASGDASTIAWAPGAGFPIESIAIVVNTVGDLVCSQDFYAARGSSCLIQISRRQMALGCAGIGTRIQHLAQYSGNVFFEIAVGTRNCRERDREPIANGSRSYNRNHSGSVVFSCEATKPTGCFGKENRARVENHWPGTKRLNCD
jgi:hypothetical protein